MLNMMDEGKMRICIWMVIIGLACPMAVAEILPLPVDNPVEHAKLATVGILQGDGADSPDTMLPVKIRGSGIHVGHGVVVTARHAVERSEGGKMVVPQTIHVVTDALRELPAERLGANAYLDVAVYQLQGSESDWPQAHVEVRNVQVTYGDRIFTVGYPLGWGPAITFGTVGNPNVFLSTVQSRLIQVDVSTCNGNSGGGLMNQQGQLVGLVHAIIQTDMPEEDRRCSRLAFALPGPLVQRVLTSVLAGKIPVFSVLGIQLQNMKKGNRWALVVAKATGPSQHAGFRKGDVLLAINGKSVASPAELKNYLIEQTEPGQTVVLEVQRGESQRMVSVTLGES
jgi:serine protease Do